VWVGKTRHALSLRHVGIYVAYLHLTNTKQKPTKTNTLHLFEMLNQRTPLPLRFS
jgi:hypothetical protein